MIKKCVFILTAIFCISTIGSIAQDINLENHPGYINLEEIKIPEKAARMTDIVLGPAFVKFVKWARGQDDEDMEKSFSGIISIRVKAFETDRDETDSIREMMSKFEKELETKNWENLVRVTKEDERVEVRVKFEEEKAVGIFVMAHEHGDEVAFVNVVGDDIDFKNMGFLGRGCFHWDDDWF